VTISHQAHHLINYHLIIMQKTSMIIGSASSTFGMLASALHAETQARRHHATTPTPHPQPQQQTSNATPGAVRRAADLRK
jgi:hypothetical protein